MIDNLLFVADLVNTIKGPCIMNLQTMCSVGVYNENMVSFWCLDMSIGGEGPRQTSNVHGDLFVKSKTWMTLGIVVLLIIILI